MSGFSQSRLAAALQQFVSKRREEVGLYAEIAEKLPNIGRGRILDVGTGSGLQLKVIHELHPHIELFGLDLSAEAIRVAEKNLKGIEVDLQVGNIECTPYEDHFFDIVTCNASMSYWKQPRACFDEIFRILKSGGSAVLFEPQKEIDIDEALEIIKANLADKSWLRRFMATNLNKFALRWGRTIGLKLYSIEELETIANESRFGNDIRIERTVLQNLPIFVRILFQKPAGEA